MPRPRYVNGLYAEDYEYLRDKAHREHSSTAELIREIVAEWVKSQQRKVTPAAPLSQQSEVPENEMAKVCLNNFDLLDEWERQFIEDNTYQDQWIGEGDKRFLKLRKAYLRIMRQRNLQKEHS